VKIDDGERSIAVDEQYVWFASNERHSSTLTKADVKTGKMVKQLSSAKIPGGKLALVVW